MEALEAAAWLVLARFLVRAVPFGRWRAMLGRVCAPEVAGVQRGLDENAAPRRFARAVERAAARLPGESRCLPRAMALQWMLRRRGLGSVLVLGVRPGLHRGGLDDLHAWVTRSGEVLIGHTADTHHPLFAAANPRGRHR